MSTIQEDDVIELAAAVIASRGFVVVAYGANQATFRFRTSSRGWKAPDLVAYREGLLVVLEAKIRPAALFATSPDAMSDHEAILFLLNSEEARRDVIAQAASRMSLNGFPVHISQVIGGLVAIGPLPPRLLSLKDPRVAYVGVARTNGDPPIFRDFNV